MYPVFFYYCEKMAAKCVLEEKARQTVRVIDAKINANIVRVEFLADQRVRGD